MKPSGSLFVLLSILIQLASIPLFYGIFELITSAFSETGIAVDFFFLKFSIINYTIIFATIIVTSIRETTKSELLTSVMHAVWILLIYSETSQYFAKLPVEYIIYMLCLVLTIPVRLIFQNRFQKTD
ncbi:MAG: hypothetical protein P8P74_13695 [Crocinitomicaceae bacterium]|nr:hypothetical protein [Crocinitomicaceae bacterium]